MERNDAHLAGLLETYDVAIAELEEWDDPAVATLIASLRTLRNRAVRQADDVSAHMLALSGGRPPARRLPATVSRRALPTRRTRRCSS